MRLGTVVVTPEPQPVIFLLAGARQGPGLRSRVIGNTCLKDVAVDGLRAL